MKRRRRQLGSARPELTDAYLAHLQRQEQRDIAHQRFTKTVAVLGVVTSAVVATALVINLFRS